MLGRFLYLGPEPTPTRTHTDGTDCFEGTRLVPDDWTPCCAEFESHVDHCVVDIRYEWWAEPESWFVIDADGHHSGFQIRFCPHCGRRLGS